MAGQPTTTGDLADSLPTILASARIVREFEGVMVRLSDRTNLADGTGLTWNEISLAQLTAQSVTETTELNNPQTLSDTLFSVTPVMVGVQTIITDRTMRRISKNVAGKIGALAQNAIQRKKDKDGLAFLDGATTSLCGAGSTLTSGHLRAAAARIRSNATEPGMGQLYGVLHGYQIKVLGDELLSGVGTGVIPAGVTADTYRNGFSGRIATIDIYEDGNMTVDASDDVKGGVFAREAAVLVDGFGPKTETQRLIRVGGGSDELIIYDEYAWGERSPGNWLYEIYSDATTPTS